MSAGYLLDTNVVSELARSRPEPHVLGWLATVDAHDLRLSVVTIYEVNVGLVRLRGRDEQRAERLRAWFVDLVTGFAGTGRVLEVTQEIAWLAGALQVPNPRETEDALLAATGIHQGLTVVTRNVRHFQVRGLTVLNPWDRHDTA